MLDHIDRVITDQNIKCMKAIISIILLAMTISLSGQKINLIAESAVIEKIGTGYSFTEGPAVSANGKVYFTDQPNDRIYVWDEIDGVSLWFEGTERSNGMYFNNKNMLVSCADLHNRLITIDENKNISPLFENYEGVHLNGPNDLWISPDGGIYFTDPYYHRGYWAEGHVEAQDTRGVYYLSTDGNVTRVVDDYVQPNGLVGTPDGKFLYIADINDGKIWRYDIDTDGTLSNKTFFAPKGSDGMTIDNYGNIYLTMGKVWIYSPEGELIQEIEFPESPSNICFGGKERDILFVTARTSVYTLKMNARGVNK